ncbi:MAG TPA: hypothetical protein VFA04_19835 [Bryobacteraceae bacterium]|nr:hypothetical protein [Bryobacteraceae bacterium]
MMSDTTRHARRVLSAWQGRDSAVIEQELSLAQAFCGRAPGGCLDDERRQLLSAVVTHLQGGTAGTAALKLLNHLSAGTVRG